MKKLTRLITGKDKSSHFIDEDLIYKKMNPAWDTIASQAFPITKGELVIWETPKDTELLWVNAPFSQFFIYLSGIVEIEVGNGEKRQFKKGDVLLVEDCEGQGHITRIIEEMTAIVVVTDKD
jgi:quercetin dioxygenase-like cupin family protein